MQRQRERDRCINGKYKEFGVFLLQKVLGDEALVYLLSIIHTAAYTLVGSSETR